ncbi:MAG: hypothetical protein KGZ63_07565 [Clostridiales bacterium]|jgi:hypothetical protein|nr:hypothetical protein [Clostridiales bacterium]
MEVADNRIPITKLVLTVVLIALVVISYTALLKYRSFTPEALKDESELVKYIFRKQKCGWQYALACQMMSDRIEDIELTLNRITNGIDFIEPRKIPLEEYFKWLVLRPETLRRLGKSVAIQCTEEFPKFIGKFKSEEQLTELKSRVLTFVRLYDYAKNFEVECHQIIPPEPYVQVHEMTYGWTEPIRDGISTFMNIMLELSSIDKKSLKAGTVNPPSFNIVFSAPNNI